MWHSCRDSRVRSLTGHTLKIALVAIALMVGLGGGAFAQVPGDATGITLVGTLESIHIDDPTDFYSGGSMVVDGTVVVIPRNLVIALPANFLTLAGLFEGAPPACVSA